MFADTSTVGDMEYQVSKHKLLNEYLERASEAMKQEPTEQEQKESEEAADEELQTEQHKAMLLDMGKEVANDGQNEDRKSTRLNSSHANISYAVFCLKKNTNTKARK